MDAARYFDNAATTPLDPRVREVMLPYLGEEFGNAHSLHAWGMRAGEAVERAREQVALLIGAEDPSQITFTSGATEANNWVLEAPHDHLWISPFEHSSMREPALRRKASTLANQGAELSRPGDSPALVSIMAVNNEIGTTWRAPDYGGPGDLIHSDLTQAVGKFPVDLHGLDFAGFSAHKFYGPKGVGALYSRDQPPEPLILGGEQERGYRGGTLNVAAIVGMGRAAEIAREAQAEDFERAQALRAALLDGLKGLADFRVHGGDRTSPYIVSVGFAGVQGETLVLDMDRRGFAISAGAACSSRSVEPSHVLTALGLEETWRRGTVRISFGRFNRLEETAELARILRTSVESLRTL